MNTPGRPPSNTAPLLVFGTGALFVFFQLVLQSSPAVLREGMVVDFSLTNAGFGGFAASFYFFYILIQIPSGLLVARYGPRRVLAVGAILCAAGCGWLAVSQSILSADAARILMGLGAGPTVVCTMTLGARWFAPRHFPLIVAITEMAGMIGAAVGQEVLGITVQLTSWRTAMIGCGVAAILLAALVWRFVRDFPLRTAMAPEVFPGAGRLMRACLQPRLLLGALAGGMVASAGMAFGLLWAVPFFEHRLAATLSQASFLSSLYFWACIPGMLFFGFVGTRGVSTATWLALGSVATTACLAMLLYGPASFLVAALFMFGLGFVNSSYALSFTLVRTEVPPDLSAPALGLANMVIMGAGCWIFQPLLGWLAGVKGRAVPDESVLSFLLFCQVVAWALLATRAFMPAAKTNGSTSE